MIPCDYAESDLQPSRTPDIDNKPRLIYSKDIVDKVYDEKYPRISQAIGLLIIFILVYFIVGILILAISGTITSDFKEHPLFNIILALFFLVFLQVLQGNAALVFQWSLMINAFIALFNLIPFGVLDGVKIFLWNKQIWALTFFAALLLTAYSFGYLPF